MSVDHRARGWGICGGLCLLALLPASAAAEVPPAERVGTLCLAAQTAGQLPAEQIRTLVAESTVLLAEIGAGEIELMTELEACRLELWSHLDPDEEFARLCGAVGDAQQQSVRELEILIADCDLLLGALEAEPDSRHKVLVFRLKKCRSFFVYSRELLENDGGSRGDHATDQVRAETQESNPWGVGP